MSARPRSLTPPCNKEACAALSEQEIQAAIAAHFAWRARPNIWWCHIANGGLRSKVEAAIMRGQGVKPGAPDLLIVADGRPYFLEVKTEAGRVSQAQADCHEELRRAGAEVGVAHGLDQALRKLEQWRLLRGRDVGASLTLEHQLEHRDGARDRDDDGSKR